MLLTRIKLLNLLGFPYTVNDFSLAVKIFFLTWTFNNLIMMCLGVDIFVIILLRVY